MNTQVEIRPRSTYPLGRESFTPFENATTSPVMKAVQEKWAGGKTIDSPESLKNKVLDESQHGRNKKSKNVGFPSKDSLKMKATTQQAETKWEFGRRKTFTRHKSTPKKYGSAILIQKMMRGWWQRLQYRLVWLQHRLDTRDTRKQASLEHIRNKTNKRKAAMKERMEARARKELEKSTIEEKTAQEGQQIISYLRKENKKLRSKNEKIFQASSVLKHNNERLENANKTTTDGFDTLNGHAKEIQETHDKLKVVVPKYESAITTMEEAVEQRRQYCISEHTIKLLYVKLLGKVVQMVEDTSNDTRLIDELVRYCLDVEGADNRMDLPEKLEAFLDMKTPEEDSDDSENFDEYTVATLEGGDSD